MFRRGEAYRISNGEWVITKHGTFAFLSEAWGTKIPVLGQRRLSEGPTSRYARDEVYPARRELGILGLWRHHHDITYMMTTGSW